jgi:putrescine transport system substrate-binding protein
LPLRSQNTSLLFLSSFKDESGGQELIFIFLLFQIICYNALSVYDALKEMMRLFVLWVMLFFFPFQALSKEPPLLYIYGWADYVPQDVIQAFEKETGIRVFYDVFDSTDTLEAQIFLNAPYDLVFPPAWPLFARGVQSDLFVRLDKKLIPNRKGLNPDLLEKLAELDPDQSYGIPYVWGTTGIGYQKETLALFLPEEPLDTWGLFFDPQKISVLAPCHPQLLDGSVDVFQAALLYLGYDPRTQNRQHWKEAMNLVASIRPFVETFENTRQIETLANHQSFLIQGFSTDVNMARRQNPKDSLVYVIPKEGAVIWVDMMAIPKAAPHPRNAHLFINFILRPEIMASITNQIYSANPVAASYPLVEKSLLEDPVIFPNTEVMKRIYPDTMLPIELQRWISRAWLKIKMGRPLD